MTPYEATSKYLNLGLSIIPIRGMAYASGDSLEKKQKDAKRPTIKWEIYQERTPIPEEINSWKQKYPKANIGIVTGKVSGGIIVIDLDKPDLAKKTLLPLIPDNLVFPIATTPSGGEHWYFRCTQELRNTVKPECGFDIRGSGGYVVAPPSTVTGTQGYAWLDGCSVFEVPIPDLPSTLLKFLALGSCPSNAKALDSPQLGSIDNKQMLLGEESRVGVVDISMDMFSLGRRDEDLFHVANMLVKGGANDFEAVQVLKNIAKSWGEENETKWLTDKVKSAFNRRERQGKSLASEVREWVLSTEGIFSSTDLYNSLGLSTSVHTREDKKNVSEILRRLRSEGIIERQGNKNGNFRKLESRVEEIDFMSGDTAPMNISWPFEIETLVHTYPKSITVVAGASNAGKTAFLLNVVNMNMFKHKIKYFSSEMGPDDLKSRLSKFDFPLDTWKQCKWMDRSVDFADVIGPDDINIIDFLELHDDFYLVGQMIKDIFDRLRKGICIIALQKNAGREHGLGGERSIEKARLYVSMDYNKIKIVKGKNWAVEGRNPNGLEIEFRLAAGCRFIPDTGWEKAEPNGVIKDRWNKS